MIAARLITEDRADTTRARYREALGRQEARGGGGSSLFSARLCLPCFSPHMCVPQNSPSTTLQFTTVFSSQQSNQHQPVSGLGTNSTPAAGLLGAAGSGTVSFCLAQSLSRPLCVSHPPALCPLRAWAHIPGTEVALLRPYRQHREGARECVLHAQEFCCEVSLVRPFRTPPVPRPCGHSPLRTGQPELSGLPAAFLELSPV